MSQMVYFYDSDAVSITDTPERAHEVPRLDRCPNAGREDRVVIFDARGALVLLGRSTSLSLPMAEQRFIDAAK